jgi:hypothetical protein
MLDRREWHPMILSFKEPVMPSTKNCTAIPVLRMLKLNICSALVAQHYDHCHTRAFNKSASKWFQRGVPDRMNEGGKKMPLVTRVARLHQQELLF